MDNDTKVIFNVNDVCNYLHTSQSSIRKLVRTKQIPYYKILSRIFFDKNIIDQWIKNQQVLNCSLLAPLELSKEKGDINGSTSRS